MVEGKSGEAKEAAERKRAEAREVYLRAANRTPHLDEESTVGEVDAAAAGRKEAMTGTLDELARKKRWCLRSKPWWLEDVKQLCCELGESRRDWRSRPAAISRFKDARRKFCRGIQRAKRECWDRFLQESKGNDVWTATRYTTPRIDKAVKPWLTRTEMSRKDTMSVRKSFWPPSFPRCHWATMCLRKGEKPWNG